MTLTQMEIMTETRRVIRRNIDEFPHLAGIVINFDKATNRVGQYHSGKHQISYSAVLMPHLSREDILDTITHEVAHAIVGVKEHHSPKWREMHRRLGGNGMLRTKRIPNEIRISISKYRAECSVTGEAISGFNRKPRRNYLCKCHNKDISLIQQR